MQNNNGGKDDPEKGLKSNDVNSDKNNKKDDEVSKENNSDQYKPNDDETPSTSKDKRHEESGNDEDRPGDQDKDANKTDEPKNDKSGENKNGKNRISLSTPKIPEDDNDSAKPKRDTVVFQNDSIPTPESGRSRSRNVVSVQRRVYRRDTLNREAEYHIPYRPFTRQLRKLLRTCGYHKYPLAMFLPIIRWLPKYNWRVYGCDDLIAGLTTAVMHIPQGMAYALLAHVEPVVGLYMAIFPIFIYILLGSSPHISLGTFSIICLMCGKVVTQIVDPDHSTASVGAYPNETSVGPHVRTAAPNSYVATDVVCAICLLVGLYQLAMFALRMGAVSVLLSEPLVSGFTTAASQYVLASQIRDVLGLNTGKDRVIYFNFFLEIKGIFDHIKRTNKYTVIISFITATCLIVNNEYLKAKLKKYTKIPVPIELLAIVTATIVSKIALLNKNYDVMLLGNVPTGLPNPKIPKTELFQLIAFDSFIITMISYTVSMSMVLVFAAKEKYEVDANQELFALGVSNVFSSFFCCAPVCASLSRSYVQYQAGAKTPVTSIVSTLVILMVVLWVGPFFKDLPRCVLATIIIVALKALLIQLADFCKFWHLSVLDGGVWLVSFWGTILLGVDIGLGAGLLASLATLFYRSQEPYCCLLGRVEHTDLYLDVKRYRGASEISGLKIFHYCGGLNFATKNLFKSKLFRKIGILRPTSDGPSVASDEDDTEPFVWDPTITQRVHCVIIDATALSYVDTPGIKTLVAIEEDLRSSNISVYISGANVPVMEMIDRYNGYVSSAERLQIQIFATVHDAVVYYKNKYFKKEGVEEEQHTPIRVPSTLTSNK